VLDACSVLAGVEDDIWRDDGEESEEEEEEVATGDAQMQRPVPVDPEQEERDAAEEHAAKLAKVGAFQLPPGFTGYSIAAQPEPASIPSVSARFKLLKGSMIAYKFADGWRTGKVWKQGKGAAYKGMLWVSYGRNMNSTGHAFDPAEYGVE